MQEVNTFAATNLYKLRFDIYDELLHFTTAQMRQYTLSGELKANRFKGAEKKKINIYIYIFAVC